MPAYCKCCGAPHAELVLEPKLYVDGLGLTYTVHPTHGLLVHYPTKDGLGAGLPFDPWPEITRTPDSPRARLWFAMLKDTR